MMFRAIFKRRVVALFFYVMHVLLWIQIPLHQTVKGTFVARILIPEGKVDIGGDFAYFSAEFQ